MSYGAHNFPARIEALKTAAVGIAREAEFGEEHATPRERELSSLVIAMLRAMEQMLVALHGHFTTTDDDDE